MQRNAVCVLYCALSVSYLLKMRPTDSLNTVSVSTFVLHRCVWRLASCSSGPACYHVPTNKTDDVDNRVLTAGTLGADSAHACPSKPPLGVHFCLRRLASFWDVIHQLWFSPRTWRKPSQSTLLFVFMSFLLLSVSVFFLFFLLSYFVEVYSFLIGIWRF